MCRRSAVPPPALQRQPELDTGSLHHQNRRKRPVLIGHMESAAEPSAAECGRDSGAGLRRRVALLAQMCQHDRAEARMVELSQ